MDTNLVAKRTIVAIVIATAAAFGTLIIPLVCVFFYMLGKFTAPSEAQKLNTVLKRIHKLLAFRNGDKVGQTIFWFGILNLGTQFVAGTTTVNIWWGFLALFIFGLSFVAGIASIEGNLSKTFLEIKETFSI